MRLLRELAVDTNYKLLEYKRLSMGFNQVAVFGRIITTLNIKFNCGTLDYNSLL